MKMFLFLLVLGYVSSDKLDLSYLPPPGSQYAGGRPGDIQIPFEFPKESYSTTLRPQAGDNRGTRPEDYEATIGIDRVPPGAQDTSLVIPGSTSFSDIQNNQKVPTTTVSYAFTQTTTHPPTEGFETTIGPQIGGFPTTDIFNNFPSQEPGVNIGQFGQGTTSAPISGSTIGNIVSQQPGFGYGGNIAQNRPGYKETINQFGQPILVPTFGPVAQFPGTPGSAGQEFFGQNIPNQQQVSEQVQPGYQQQNSKNLPGASSTPFEQNKYRNQSVSQDFGFGNRPGYIPSSVAPQGFVSTSQPGRIVPGSPITIPQSNFPGQQINAYQPGENIQPGQEPIGQQQYPGSRVPTQFGGTRPNVYQPSSTAVPAYTPGLSQQIGSSVGPEYIGDTQYTKQGIPVIPQQFSGSQRLPGANDNIQNVFQPSTAAPAPGISIQDYTPGAFIPSGQRDQQLPGSQANAVSSVNRILSDRPQAEADRNAIILNYENVITPEGFAYSFDTSNGIHADESGTATDGVKAKGSYSYIGDDGKEYFISYTADENGFRPRGDHLPTPPPIPDAIQRIIEQAAKEKEAGISHDGFYDEDKYGDKKYQSTVNRRPQFSNKNNSDADNSGTIGTNSYLPKDRLKSQSKQKNPSVLEVDSSFGEDITVPDLEDNKQTTSGDDNKIGQISTQRPDSQVTDYNGEDNENSDFEEVDRENLPSDQNPTNRPFLGTSKRPGQTVRKQYNIVNVPSSEEYVIRNGDKKRPIGGRPSSQSEKQGQVFDEYAGYEEPEYDDNVNTNQYINNGPKRRPTSTKNDNQYEYEATSVPDSYEDESYSQRPTTPILENGEIVNQQTVDRYGRPIYKVPTRRPVSGLDKFEDKPGSDESYNKQIGGKKQSSSRPSTYFPDNSQTVTDDYSTSKDFVTKSPVKYRPNISLDQNVPKGMRQKPQSSRVKVYGPSTTEKIIEYNPDNEEYIDLESDVDDKTNSQIYNRRRPTSRPTSLSKAPLKKLGEQNKDLDQESEDYITSHENDSRRPNVSSSTKIYEGSSGRPESVNQTPDYQRAQEFKNKQIISRPGTKFGQKIVRPSFNQETSHKEIQDGTGYQYIPPRQKFEQDEAKRFPNRFTGSTTRRPITGRPTSSPIYFEGTDKSSKPFMTPNVSTVRDQGISSRRPTIMVINQDSEENQLSSDNDSQYPDGGTTSDQAYGDDEISSTGPIEKFTTSTYRPINQQTGGRPQINEKTIQKGRPMPSHGTDNRFYKGTKSPYGLISSTTPMPSTRPYGSTLEPAQPGQKIGYYTSDGKQNKLPGQGLISSTTHSPTTAIPYEQDSTRSQYQTTYKPLETTRPINDYEDVSDQRLPAVGPTGSGANTPGLYRNQYQGSLPSTTYRPNYPTAGQNLPSSTARPSRPIDRFGNPIPSVASDNTNEMYLPGQYQATSTVRPGGVNVYGKPTGQSGGYIQEENIQPSTSRPSISVDQFRQPIRRPGAIGDQVLIQGARPTSTARPAISADNFGRPNNPPSSDMVQDYGVDQKFIQDSARPSSTARPGILVDNFGRPVNQPSFELSQKYGADRQSQPTSTARPGALFDAYGRPISSSATPQEYTPSYSTPGTIEQGVNIRDNTELGQYQPGLSSSIDGFRGQQNYEQGVPTITGQRYQPSSTSATGGPFRGQQKYRPGLNQGLSQTFQPSTERIIGEDFSGPKQQLKFDPETGYYY